MPKVSVMVPAYNAEAFILPCLRSALNQEGVDLEAIIVDDASTDNTLHLIGTIGDPRLRVLRNDRNRGEFFSRNRVIDEARGDWIAILDADDEWLPGRIARLLARAERENADLLADNLIIREQATQKTYEAFSRNLLSDLRTLSIETFVNNDRPDGRVSFGHMQPIIRTDFLRSHHIKYPDIGAIAGDFTFCLECLLKGGKYLVDPTPGYIYNIHSASISNNPRRRAWMDFLTHGKHVVDLANRLGRPDLVPALKSREELFRRYVSYREFADPLKQGKIWAATANLALKPTMMTDVFRYLLLAVKRRMLRQMGPMYMSRVRD